MQSLTPYSGPPIPALAILACAVSSGVAARLPRRPAAGRGTDVATSARGFQALRHCDAWHCAPLDDETGAYLEA